jgi:glycogen phosphorylase
MNNNPATYNFDEVLTALTGLAMDLHWSWNHAADKIWKRLDSVLWELTYNPLVVLQTVSQDRVKEVLDDPMVRDIIAELVEVKRELQVTPLWFQKAYPDSHLQCVAYFSMEFMLSEALPIYSGGLGNVAGDHLKTASDLGVPIVGVGLLYQQGYTRQIINADGTQQYVAPFNDPGQLPITPIRQPNGERLRIEVRLPGYSVWLLTWQVQVGRTTLLLLDSNDAANFPLHRGITSKLYGGGAWLRLMQELVLGIGGWLLLKKLGYNPQVCHLNEGHAAFVVVERALDYMRTHHTTFEEALAVTRSGNIFTTHTAIGAGFDRFEPDLIEQYLGSYIRESLQLTLPQFLALGRINKDDETETFNTGFLAINGSGFINGVSRLHGQVSRQLFAPLYPRWPVAEVPVGHITNGVHMPTWDSPEADRLWTEVCGKDRWMGTQEGLEQNMLALPDERLWALRCAGEEAFIQFIRKRYARQLATLGMPPNEIKGAETIFDPAVLTLGFARRMASYKRPQLLLKNIQRLKRIFLNEEKPVQLILAGKAHDGDKRGQAIIHQWIQTINEHGLQHKILFLSDYDMLLTGHLVQGADLWINTPQRPWEACGTSGMKVLVNGGLNVSTLDGWWDEAYSPGLGWAIGSRDGNGEDGDIDDREAEALYDLLEYEIIPLFYKRNEAGIPEGWVSRMRQSMARLTPLFSANRCLRQYTESYYLPAATAYVQRAAGNSARGRQLVAWRQHLQQHWQALRFDSLTIKGEGAYVHFFVQVALGGLQPADVQVQLYADGLEEGAHEVHQMKPCTTVFSNESITVYEAGIKTTRPAAHYTPRVVPGHPYAVVPLECSLIAWYR